MEHVVAMTIEQGPSFDPKSFLAKVGEGGALASTPRIGLSSHRVILRIWFLHPDRQGQDHRHFRARQGSHRRNPRAG